MLKIHYFHNSNSRSVLPGPGRVHSGADNTASKPGTLVPDPSLLCRPHGVQVMKHHGMSQPYDINVAFTYMAYYCSALGLFEELRMFSFIT